MSRCVPRFVEHGLESAQLVAFEAGERSAAGEGDPVPMRGTTDDGHRMAGAREIVQCTVHPVGCKPREQRPGRERAPGIQPRELRIAPHRARTREYVPTRRQAPHQRLRPSRAAPPRGRLRLDRGARTHRPGRRRAQARPPRCPVCRGRRRPRPSLGRKPFARRSAGRTSARTAAPSTGAGSRSGPPRRPDEALRSARSVRSPSRASVRPRAVGALHGSPQCARRRAPLPPDRGRAACPRTAPPHPLGSSLRAAARMRETIVGALRSPRRHSH